ncbi:MAG: alpha/beta hydrolase [Pseudomonadota bacterium]
MLSFQARMINDYLRRTMKPLPLPEMDPVEVRGIFENAPSWLLPKDVRAIAVDEAGPGGHVKGEWHLAPGLEVEDPDRRAILYFHGGGYVFGSPHTHRSLTFALTRRAGLPTFSLDYRLAPEHPCPAAVDDAAAAFDWLLAQGRKPSQIVVGGDSAGGGLALALMQRLRGAGREGPAGAFLYSPWTDLTGRAVAVEENGESDVMFMPDTIRNGGPRYAGRLPLTDPRVSPLFGEIAGLPPMLIFASASEVLRDDSVRLAEKARDAGVKADLILKQDLAHVWPVFTPAMPEANAALRRTVSFVASVLS